MYLGLVLGVLPQMVGAALQRECTGPALGPVPRPLGRGLLAAVVFCDLLIQRPDSCPLGVPSSLGQVTLSSSLWLPSSPVTP